MYDSGMRRAFLIIILVACSLQVVWGQESLSLLEDSLFIQQAEQGVQAIYNLNFEQADSLFQALSQHYPGHPVGPFLQALNIWWRILLDLEDTSLDRPFLRILKEVIRRSDRRLKNNPEDLDGLFFKGLALGLRARHRSNRGQQVRALLDARKAIGLVVRLARMNPTHNDLYFGWGIYDYFAGVLPQRYPWLKPLRVLFPRGERERGLQELKRVFQAGRLFKAEAAYFLAMIYYLYEPNVREAIRYVTYLRTHYPQNAYFHLLEVRIYARWGWRASMEAAAREMVQRFETQQPGYTLTLVEEALYLLGRSAMRRGDYATALQYFARVDSLGDNRPDTYARVYAYLRTAMILDALGKRPQAVPYYRKVLLMKDIARSHERAWKYLKEPYGEYYQNRLLGSSVQQ